MRRRVLQGEPSIDPKPGSTELATSAGKPEAPISSRNRLLLCGIVVAIQCFLELALETSKVPRAADGHRVFKTNKFTLNIMVEVAKLGISLAFLLAQLGPSALRALMLETTALQWLKTSVPAIIYCAQNNLIYLVHDHLTNVDVLVLMSSKFVLSGLARLAVFGTKRAALCRRQWLALVVVTVGSIVAQLAHVDKCGPQKAAELQSEGRMFGLTLNRAAGIGLLLLCCLLSAVAGTYTELILKSDRTPVMWQGIRLYVMGLALNCANFVGEGNQITTAFEGFSVSTWGIILGGAIYGVLVSVMLKHLDMFAKQFSVQISSFLVTLASVYLIGVSVPFESILGLINTSAGILIYYS